MPKRKPEPQAHRHHQKLPMPVSKIKKEKVETEDVKPVAKPSTSSGAGSSSTSSYVSPLSPYIKPEKLSPVPVVPIKKEESSDDDEEYEEIKLSDFGLTRASWDNMDFEKLKIEKTDGLDLSTLKKIKKEEEESSDEDDDLSTEESSDEDDDLSTEESSDDDDDEEITNILGCPREKCKKNKVSFSCQSKLWSHLLTVHPINRSKYTYCNYCLFKVPRIRGQPRPFAHLKKKHPEFLTTDSLDKYRALWRFKCYLCNKFFPTVKERNDHIDLHKVLHEMEADDPDYPSVLHSLLHPRKGVEDFDQLDMKFKVKKPKKKKSKRTKED